MAVTNPGRSPINQAFGVIGQSLPQNQPRQNVCMHATHRRGSTSTRGRIPRTRSLVGLLLCGYRRSRWYGIDNTTRYTRWTASTKPPLKPLPLPYLTPAAGLHGDGAHAHQLHAEKEGVHDGGRRREAVGWGSVGIVDWMG